MHVVILAAGYGTRLTQDLQADTSGEWEHIKNCPKPLLPLGNKPLVTRWVLKLRELEEIDKICVITNDKFYQQFVAWKDGLEDEELEKKIVLYNDFSSCNEDRLGAVADLQLAAEVLQPYENILVIAGDTIFREEFDIETFCQKKKEIQTDEKKACLICHTTCSEDEVHKHGIVELDQNMKVVKFLEKPNPKDTVSRFQSPCFYILSKAALRELKTFLEIHKDESIEKKDATGKFLQFIVDIIPVFSSEVPFRFDLGNLPSYVEANNYFLKF